ncbi:hypothetical protein HQ308_14930 [Rhodococcus sp. BP-241]|uniref:hypothetical protein n=1 Tax=Rhodococcus sp. BP-241 TaxID=2739441 RepID=UPI001C9B0AF3|nr:hypothetical protein [Rhodococcus sp. BP-241]MBY6708098.1 hypothetical protein [Rhodococcus sp. BP-241]
MTTSSICSPMERTVTPMIDPITQDVMKLYLEHVGLPTELSPEDQQEFLERESERIAERIDNMKVHMQDQVLTRYVRENGHPAPYLEQVGLINQAWQQATDFVINEEIYNQLPEEMEAYPPDQESSEAEAERDRARIQVHRSDPERWRNPLNCADPDKEAGDLTELLWEERPMHFRYFAAHLIAARIEDSQPYPTSRQHPLYPSFTNLLDERVAERAASGK